MTGDNDFEGSDGGPLPDAEDSPERAVDVDTCAHGCHVTLTFRAAPGVCTTLLLHPDEAAALAGDLLDVLGAEVDECHDEITPPAAKRRAH